MAKTENTVMFFVGTAVFAWVIHSQMIKPLQLKKTSMESVLTDLTARIETVNQQGVKNNALKADLEAARPAVEAIAKVFPPANMDNSRLSAMLDGATHDLTGVNILKAPPLKTGEQFWRSRVMPIEDLKPVYTNLVGESALREIKGGDKVEPVVKLTRVDQEWELEAEWDAFPQLLTKLSQLEYYFEVTNLEVVAVMDPAMRKEFKLPKTGVHKPPKKVKARLTASTVAFPPLPAKQ
jgi:hypothetical protein